MAHPSPLPPKPRATLIRPEITRLPRLTWWRRIVRRLIKGLARLLVWAFIRLSVSGRENLPTQGPALVVANHLGDADLVIGLAVAPFPPDYLAKAELYDYPLLGQLLDAYGVIWVHRGQPDRRALQAAIQGLKEGRLIAIAPEGRESLSGALEEGTGGAAYLALKADIPLLPVTFTGSENARIYANLKRLRRTQVTVTIGPLFRLESLPDRRQSIRQGTLKIMRTLAAQLPAEYRGVYADVEDVSAMRRPDQACERNISER